jgi:hypothetical protein
MPKVVPDRAPLFQRLPSTWSKCAWEVTMASILSSDTPSAASFAVSSAGSALLALFPVSKRMVRVSARNGYDTPISVARPGRAARRSSRGRIFRGWVSPSFATEAGRWASQATSTAATPRQCATKWIVGASTTTATNPSATRFATVAQPP